MRKNQSPEDRHQPAGLPRWHRWLSELPAACYLLAAVAVAALIITFVLWLESRTLALVAGLSFLALFLSFLRGVWQGWDEARTVERVIGVMGCLLLLGGCAAKLVQFFLLR